MQYLITALEGISSFLSPCMLPLLPVYLSYFAGETKQKSKTLLRALFFVLGFSAVFSLLGLFAGSVGALLAKYQTAVNIVSGLVVIVFGLSFLDVIRLPFFKGAAKGLPVRRDLFREPESLCGRVSRFGAHACGKQRDRVQRRYAAVDLCGRTRYSVFAFRSSAGQIQICIHKNQKALSAHQPHLRRLSHCCGDLHVLRLAERADGRFFLR